MLSAITHTHFDQLCFIIQCYSQNKTQHNNTEYDHGFRPFKLGYGILQLARTHTYQINGTIQ